MAQPRNAGTPPCRFSLWTKLGEWFSERKGSEIDQLPG
jgi:hypothetical protein